MKKLLFKNMFISRVLILILSNATVGVLTDRLTKRYEMLVIKS
jgi:hypothetical protein